MTTYPRPSDPPSAFSRADGSSELHSTHHGRLLGMGVNALQFLKGDGTTEDAAQLKALESALTAGGLCVWPSADYAFPDGVGLTVSAGTTHRGESRANITVKDAYAFTTALPTTDVVRIENFYVETRLGSTTGGAIDSGITGGLINSQHVYKNVVGSVASYVGGTEPMFRIEGHIGTRVDDCYATGAPVGFYWGTGGNFSNTNSMYRCRGAPVDNTETYNGINAGLYGDEAVALGVRDCTFESAYHGYGAYLDGCVNVVLDNSWCEANQKDNVHLVDSAYCTVSSGKFHGMTPGDATAVHIRLRNTLGAGRHETNMLLASHFQDAAPSGKNITIGANVEHTFVVGEGYVAANDSGTDTTVVGRSLVLPFPAAKLKVATARAAAAAGGDPDSLEAIFAVRDATDTNYFMVGSRGYPIFRTGSTLTSSDELQTKSFALFFDPADGKVKARVRDNSGVYSTHILSN